jgi:hypothetical protein
MTSKVERAEKHICELEELLTEKRPFKYVWEYNARTGENATFAQRDETVIVEAAGIAADALHNLRSALDHAYWAIVSPFATTPSQERAIQFPFSATADRLVEGIRNRLALRVSQNFFDELVAIAPHGEPGGNEILYAVHHFNGIDKHRQPIPLADYKRITSIELAKQIDNFPPGLFMDVNLGKARRDIVWHSFPMCWLSEHCIFQKELDVPVEIVIELGLKQPVLMLDTLRAMVTEVENTIRRIRAAA